MTLDFLFGDNEKKEQHKWNLRRLCLEKESLERNHAEELKSLDRDVGALYERRRTEEMTSGEVLNEWDKRRGDIRERQLGELAHVENDILFHETGLASSDFLELRKEIIYPLFLKIVLFFAGFLFGIIVEHVNVFSSFFDWFR